ncbi:MAG: HNH endonuclease [Candidatus Yanofskybacteria bacterium GW2011_GWE1_40_10]|nr:MAG: HNH endonuclease [Candidatus Yanofskybacteria bacterium GW2011_GWE1_40_10]
MDNGKCLACGNASRQTVDHVQPLVKGGSNYIDNIQPICGKCNRSKWMSTIDYRPDKGEFARRLRNG